MAYIHPSRQHLRQMQDYIERQRLIQAEQGFTPEDNPYKDKLYEHVVFNEQESDFGILQVKPASQWLRENYHNSEPNPLWLSLWNEGELCCLFADSNLGKSIYAVEIARKIAEDQTVLYCDFEMSDKQFQTRYSDENGNIVNFSPNLLRCVIDPEELTEKNIEDFVIKAIRDASLAYKAKVIVIDNITFLSRQTFSGDSAAKLMRQLVQLKKSLKLSILVLAHTPKRALSAPITQNDLAGSKLLFNFFDSCFAIGQSAKDPGLRYIKQIKCRGNAFEYGADNVIVADIDKTDGWLHFHVIGHSPEKEHLSKADNRTSQQLYEEIRKLQESHQTIRQIAEALSISKTTVSRLIKSHSPHPS